MDDGFLIKITIDAYFDSDRLDLPRAGIIPDPAQMATKEGAVLATNYHRP